MLAAYIILTSQWLRSVIDRYFPESFLGTMSILEIKGRNKIIQTSIYFQKITV
jgi:hypothetical protein